VIRRRPIPRSRDYPTESLRYETIMDGAVRVYPEGREVCDTKTRFGNEEYRRRVKLMWERQGRRCCDCGRPMALLNATFEHQRRRGMGAAWRDDRITKDNEDFNGAAHWLCNGVRG
jgi:hypothetical protein